MTGRDVMRGLVAAGVAAGALLGVSACGVSSSAHGGASSSKPPKTITVGTLYSSSGSFAASSLPEYAGLKYWVSQVNGAGGVYVRAFHKRIPVKLVAYNDQSSPTTAATLYDQLITQNHVDVLIPDFGSVLTAPAVQIAKEHQQLLFDDTASGTSLFSPGNPYIVMAGIRSSGLWPDPLVSFMLSKHLKRIAILYCANDFDASQSATILAGLKAHGVTPVYYQSTPTDTSTYGSLINSIAATHPQAVVELGYQNNDIAFLNALSSSGLRPEMVFTAFPGQLHALLQKDVGTKGLEWTYSYGFPPQVSYAHPTLGLNTAAFVRDFGAQSGAPVNFLNASGYATGLIVQAALAHAPKFTQLSMRSALSGLSGHLVTLLGPFQINSLGEQVGEFFPVSQMFPGAGGTQIKIVYPASLADATARFPAP
jgi:branched-chain amino acid transport system substrate-binding protein